MRSIVCHLNNKHRKVNAEVDAPMGLHGDSYLSTADMTAGWFTQHRDGKSKGLWMQINGRALAQHYKGNAEKMKSLPAS